MSSLPQKRSRSRSLKRRIHRAGLGFEASILEELVEKAPDNIEYLAALGETYTRLRRYRRGLDVDLKLVAKVPDDPIIRYNLACSQVLTGNLDGACASLLKAFELGYRDFEHLRHDPDLRRLHNDCRFVLVQEHFEQHYGSVASH